MITELMKTKRLYFDGGTGTLLQQMGLSAGEAPEIWNLTAPEKITALHKAYLDAGSDIICMNTFGINRDKYRNYEELISAAAACAKAAVNGRKDKFIAFDMGPTGRLLEPLGDLPFEDAVSLFADNVKAAAANGADLILIETMNDSYETKAAVLAAKENCSLPVFVTNVYDQSGRLMTGADPASMVALLEGLGADALGINCSLGPDAMLPVVSELVKYSSLPVIVNPNAGLPETENGSTVYKLGAKEFSESMRRIAETGACILGGCCGTTPEYIKLTVAATEALPFKYPSYKETAFVSSYSNAAGLGVQPLLIGERINPTGKPKFKEALRRGDINYIINEGIKQAEKGAHILDVNVGLPEIDEPKLLAETVAKLQAVCDLPLQIDTSSPAALEKALRIYNGKPLVNSVNGARESMDHVFPAVKKYGGAVIALTLDESGIPETPEQRFEIARRIIACAEEYGIPKKDIIVDPLALTVSSNQESARVTLKTIRLLKNAGIKTSLGVSNISFGLPRRELINSVFFAAALENGLDLAIMNPFSADMMNVYYAFRALYGLDTACKEYINYAAELPDEASAPAVHENDLKDAVIKGIKESAVKAAQVLCESEAPLDIINNYVIPALNEIGTAFENKKAYLPQLLMSAEAASAAFEIVKGKLPVSQRNGKKVIIATVKGDIHDIGKNIVRVMLESYGFDVIDLGRDVPPETVLEKALAENCRLVGLSALMTTTVPAMEETIRLLHSADMPVTVMVGGAVLTSEYAEMIKADYYAKDAMESVRFAEKFYS